jgi:hypothetical protein
MALARALASLCDSLRIMAKAHLKQPGWARIRDAQGFAPVSRSQFYTWIADGSVRTARIGGARFVDMESLKQLFEHAAAKKTPKRISERMRQRAYASHLAREERKAEPPKVRSR